METPRELTSHKVNGLNEHLSIHVLDEPGQGGACHDYLISLGADEGESWDLQFQNGPIKEAGFNGMSQEALLAIVEDRLKSFQEGPYVSDDNAQALIHVQQAMMWLQKRTHDRMRRGVEGTHEK